MLLNWLFLALQVVSVLSVSITDIQGPSFQSPMVGKSVTGVTGIVTAKASNGFYIQGQPSSDIRESYGLFVFSESTKILDSVTTGDEISLSGKVAEFRETSATDVTFLTDTELDDPASIKVLSTRNTVTPLVLGPTGPGARSPPTEKLSALDVGPDGWLSVPNNVSRIDEENADLQPTEFGIDFWQSLEGVLVTVKSPISLGFPNDDSEFWVRGDWPATGINSRGGLSINIGSDGIPDANPETVIIGQPLDGSTNPQTATGKQLSDITGVVQQQFGFLYILPLTAPTIISSPSATVPPTTLTSSTDPCTLTLGDYNVDNFAPNSATQPQVAGQIVSHLLSPDIIFLQEIQDNSGPTDDGTVDASLTLSTLVNNIVSQGGSFTYSFTEVISQNDQDGGETGGNIRPAILFRDTKLSLVSGPPVGAPLDATQAVLDDGQLSLTFNPGRLDPTNSVWESTRKPLVAVWETTNGNRFITINVHNTAKSDVPGSSTQGDDRPPVNLDVTKRTQQVETIATFVQSILDLDPNANIIVGGDFNEFTQTRSVFAAFENLLFEVDELADIPLVERYTYVFDQNNEQLDHIFVSQAISEREVEAEHIHVNNWSEQLSDRASDHDPTVVRLRVC